MGWKIFLKNLGWCSSALGLMALGVFLPLGLATSCSDRPGDHLFWVLQASWASYRENFISPEGRVVLAERQQGTISEAQAYALLRAVWAGDEDTFRRVYRWTRTHLSREKKFGDRLLAWHWGRQADGSWGVLDWNTASDADLDYALALMLAARRGWRAPPDLPDYDSEARQVSRDLLAHEVMEVPPGLRLLGPGNWRRQEPPFLLNPSYFSPAAYRLLAQSGCGPEFGRLHADTYNFLKSLAKNFGGVQGVGLVPDWLEVTAEGDLTPCPERSSRFGWEAVRLPWRLAVDRLWYGDLKAAGLCREHFLPFFRREWHEKKRLVAEYGYDGTPRADFESPVLYAGALAAGLAGGDPEFAWQMAQKILSFYREEGSQAYFVSPSEYYANNWAWFGLALYAGWVRLY